MHQPSGHSSTLTFSAGSCLPVFSTPSRPSCWGISKAKWGPPKTLGSFVAAFSPVTPSISYLISVIYFHGHNLYLGMKTLSSQISASLPQEPSIPCFFPTPPPHENMHRPLTTLSDTHLGALSVPLPVCLKYVGCLSRGQRRASPRPDSKPYMLQHGVYLSIAASFQ